MKWEAADWERLGRRIRQQRESLGLSREKLAEIAETSPKTIQNAEEGRVPTRWPTTFGRIEAALGWLDRSLRDILDGGEPAPWWPGRNSNHPSDADRRYIPGSQEQLAQIRFREGRGYHVSTAEAMSIGALEQVEELPKEIEDRVKAVLEFGALCEKHGVSPSLTERYDDIVTDLLSGLVEARRRGGPAPVSVGSKNMRAEARRMQDASFSAYAQKLHAAAQSGASEEIGRLIAERSGVSADLVARLTMESRAIQESLENLRNHQATVTELYEQLHSFDRVHITQPALEQLRQAGKESGEATSEDD